MPDSHPTATLFGTHTRKISSAIIGEEYEISVWLPPDYADSPDKNYPVVYVLDADVAFGTVAHMGWMMVFGQDVPPMIVIGIGWAITSSDDWNYKRSRDLVPCSTDVLPISGGAEDFLSFIESEALPFVNANYRTDPTRQILLGDSASGLFGLYALLKKPNLFRGVVAGSPAIWICVDLMIELEQSVASSGAALSGAVYMCFGSLEGDWVKPAEAFFNVLASRNYENLALKYEILEGETHSTVIARALLTGLRTVFKMLET